MQRSEVIPVEKVSSLLSCIFQEPAIAYQNYSDFDSNLHKYNSAEQLLEAINHAIDIKSHSANFVIYYPQSNGFIYEEKISLNPAKCNGSTFRYVLNGWGLIALQLDLRNLTSVNITVSVNSQKRAEAWWATCLDFKDPALWDWKFVERQARRTIRVLSKLS